MSNKRVSITDVTGCHSWTGARGVGDGNRVKGKRRRQLWSLNREGRQRQEITDERSRIAQEQIAAAKKTRERHKRATEGTKRGAVEMWKRSQVAEGHGYNWHIHSNQPHYKVDFNRIIPQWKPKPITWL